ncbi:hypothetical protein I8752_27620 [Nostocaceae cyanobacterium CENA369]|uniref:Uncharacterized protein n=1 Tax=Dendronalium phyllosphericum CENA369 TaxID=1725256 RepID=A0A8J7I645_9NOST|nr:hypothetical protein [Dendronalium phyllosphericum]MBH8576691.1 hypothetical protein [Dendronalium phyllosphericum CENA369]
MVNYFVEHRFSYKQKYSASKILAVASLILGLITSSCSQKIATNVAANSDFSSNSLTTKTTEKNNVNHLGYQKGGIIAIARQRGELERQK